MGQGWPSFFWRAPFAARFLRHALSGPVRASDLPVLHSFADEKRPVAVQTILPLPSCVLLAVVLFGCVSVSVAQERSWYAGIGAGASRLQPDPGNNSGIELTDDQSGSVSAWLGRDLSRRFSGEVGLATLGDATLGGSALAGEETISYSALSGGLVAYVLGDSRSVERREALSAYVRGGLSVMDYESDLRITEDDNLALWLGAGAEWPVSRRISLRAELVSYDGDAQAAYVGFVSRLRPSRRPVLTPRAPKVEPIESRKPTSEPAETPTPLETPKRAGTPELTSEPAETPKRVEAPKPAEIPTSVETPEPVVPPKLAKAPKADEPEAQTPSSPEAPRSSRLPVIKPLPAPADAPIATAPEASALASCVAAAPGEPLDARGCAMFSGVIAGVDFVQGTSRLTPVAQVLLDRLVSDLMDHPSIIVEIQSHTEDLGDAERAQALSKERAVAVARHLAGAGVPVARLRARAFGASQPRATNNTRGGRKLNNRVALRVLP